MSLAEYQGPKQNHTGIFKHLIGETIEKAFVDAQGTVWLVTRSGHSLRFNGFNFTAPAFEVVDPTYTNQAIEIRQNELRGRIQEIRHLAPGVDL